MLLVSGFSTSGVNVMTSSPSVIWDVDGFDMGSLSAAGLFPDVEVLELAAAHRWFEFHSRCARGSRPRTSADRRSPNCAFVPHPNTMRRPFSDKFLTAQSRAALEIVARQNSNLRAVSSRTKVPSLPEKSRRRVARNRLKV
jgi:hypothetical protein